MKSYTVVYMVCGTHYRYRCMAENKKAARNSCKKNMAPEKIIEIEEE